MEGRNAAAEVRGGGLRGASGTQETSRPRGRNPLGGMGSWQSREGTHSREQDGPLQTGTGWDPAPSELGECWDLGRGDQGGANLADPTRAPQRPVRLWALRHRLTKGRPAGRTGFWLHLVFLSWVRSDFAQGSDEKSLGLKEQFWSEFSNVQVSSTCVCVIFRLTCATCCPLSCTLERQFLSKNWKKIRKALSCTHAHPNRPQMHCIPQPSKHEECCTVLDCFFWRGLPLLELIGVTCMEGGLPLTALLGCAQPIPTPELLHA